VKSWEVMALTEPPTVACARAFVAASLAVDILASSSRARNSEV
jgi:hypothetical protein